MELINKLPPPRLDSTCIPAEMETVLAGTIRTNYFRTGNGNPVILLHGGGAGAMAWRPVINDLSMFFCAIAPDLVGYGESDKPYASYDRRFFSGWLKGFMDALGLKNAILVGHSLGGAIALQFALDYPHDVERLVLVNSAGLGLPFPLMPFLNGVIFYSFPSTKTSWNLHTCLVHRAQCLDKKFIEYAGQVCQKPGGRRAFWGGCGRAVLPIRSLDLRKITHRTMLIWGADDRVLSLAHAYRAMRFMPHARLHVIPQAGHIPFFDQPEVFNTVLVKSLKAKC